MENITGVQYVETVAENRNNYTKVQFKNAKKACFYVFFPGFPQVEYRWMKDGVFLSDFSSEHFYKIQSVSRSDAGDYRCYAKNSVGTIISEKIKLTVACKESLLL